MKREFNICKDCEHLFKSGYWSIDFATGVRTPHDLYGCGFMDGVGMLSKSFKEYSVPIHCPYRMEHQLSKWNEEDV